MGAKRWMLVIGVALLGIAMWWYWQTDVYLTEPAPGSATRDPVVESMPVSVESKAPPRLAVPLAQVANETIAATATKDIDDYVDWQRELVASLIVAGDADSIMAAALVLHALYAADTAARQQIRMLLARAYSLAPGDRAIASVVLRVCRSMQECAAARYEAAFRTIDASNVLGPMPELLTKIEKGTPGQVTEALATLGELQLNLRNAELITRVARAIYRAPTSPRFAPPTGDLLRLQSELALRAVGAVEVPSYLTLGSACQSRKWRNVMACESIVGDLGRSELIELQRLGMEIEAVRVDNRVKRPIEIEDAENYLNWVGSMKARSPPTAEQWIALLAQHRTELAASRAWLERSGITQRRVPRWLERSR